jgi:hypothetical protein
MITRIIPAAALTLAFAVSAQAGHPPRAIVHKPVVHKPIIAHKPVIHHGHVHAHGFHKHGVINPAIHVGYKPAVTVVTNYHVKHAVKHNFGYVYKGHSHYHWTKVIVNPTYGCRVFWCPSVSVWYYWCAPDQCFYPVSYCPYGTYTF